MPLLHCIAAHDSLLGLLHRTLRILAAVRLKVMNEKVRTVMEFIDTIRD